MAWQRTCIMGCAWKNGEPRHRFPIDPQRRAEWCRILGIYPRVKRVFICGDHFIDGYFYGSRLSKHAKPNPPASRNLNYNKTNRMEYKDFYINSILAQDISTLKPHESSNSNYPIQSEKYDTNSLLAVDISTSYIEDNKSQETFVSNTENDSQSKNNIPFLWENISNQSFSEDNTGKIEDFEIRKDTTNDTIIKGRYIQTNDYLVVSYTPPRKWTLQEQVEKLDRHCEAQLKQIKTLNRENSRLRKENKLYEKVLPKLRYLQTKNRCLMAALKIYKEREAELKKTYKKHIMKKNDEKQEYIKN